MLYRFLEALVCLECLILPPIYGPRLRQPVMIRAALLPGPAAYRLPRTGKERATFPPQPRPGSVDNQVYVDGQTYALTGGGVQAAINGSAPGTVVIQRATITLGTTGLTVPNNCDVGGVGQAATTLMFRSTAETSFIRNASGGPTNIRIHALTLDGGGGTSTSEGCVGMNAVTAPTDITIARVTCQNIGGSAIDITGTAASPGQRVKVLSSKIINAGLATGIVGQLYGVMVSFNSQVRVADTEVGGGGLTCGICAFSSINASSASPIVDIKFTGNRVHDLPFHSTPGAAFDIGRARQAVVSDNVVYNLAQGGCVTFESVWGGVIANNECSVADMVLTGGPIVVKIPDTTQSGEAASRDISIVANTITDNSPAETTNGDITINGAERDISVRNNVISHLNQQTTGGSPVYLQLGVNDANINAAGQNFCRAISVTGNTVTNRPGSRGATNAGIKILEMTSNCVPDQIVISNNVVKGFLSGVSWAALASDGLTHLYIHDNAVEGNTRGLSTDSHSYSSLFCWNNRARRH